MAMNYKYFSLKKLDNLAFPLAQSVKIFFISIDQWESSFPLHNLLKTTVY